ncbi:restriction endonuclease subunit S [Streptococcus thermophilus]|nr:restriction endonuclease subunit S [Streptococcus thermophilus]MCE2333473.1 restriction endonuclease subunit S [Streptococcus thermophilus]
MMSKKVPELRFKGFMDDWEERKLGELSNIVGGGTPSTSNPEYWDGDIDWYTPAEIGEQSYVSKSKKTITELGLKKSSARILPVGTVLFTSRAGIGNTAILAKEATTNQGFQSIVPIQNKLDSYFIFSRTNELKRYGEVTGAGSTFVEVSGKQMSKMSIMVPELSEQQKIGSFFKHLDDTIALYQRKLDLLKEQKKGFLQKMFPKNGAKVPELRFAGFADDWELRKLGDTKTHFTDGNYGESYPSAKDMSDKENGVPFLRASNFSNGYLDSSNVNYIRPEKHAELTSGHIQQDDIILAVRGSLGTLGYATQENEGWNINSQLAILRTNKSEILGNFLIQYLLGSKGQKEILSRNTGTALKQLPIKQLKDIPVPIPTLEEQQKIGSFFKQLDDTIALHQRKLDLLKEQKKGFLQKMFV